MAGSSAKNLAKIIQDRHHRDHVGKIGDFDLNIYRVEDNHGP